MRVLVAGVIAGALVVAGFSSASFAQERVEEGLEATASGEAYLKSLRLRGVDTDVAYFDPTRPAPELDTRRAPEPDSASDVLIGGPRSSFVTNVIAVMIVLTVAFLFLRFGGRFTVSLRGDEDAQRVHGSGRDDETAAARLPSDLDAISRIEDRRLALVTLAQSALMQAITQQGLFLQKSWTARDALRRLPKEMNHREALRDLVAAGERVLFGGRDVPEADFQDYLSRIRPLFAESTS